MPSVSVIVRFKNEGKYLAAVLAAVRAQEFPEGSIFLIGVDNGSSDASRVIAERYCDLVLEIANYFPGAALNLALRASACDYAAMLSAHTIPSGPGWLSMLYREACKPNTLGVYGAQVYPFYSGFLDKRDLSIFSTARSRIETRDSDFWNANSMIPRTAWETKAFDERVFELEDHYWTKCALNGSNCVRFVADAIVYHYSHSGRNDRHLPPQLISDPDGQLTHALGVLGDREACWPDVMMAVLTVKTLRQDPRTRRAIPNLVHLLAEHWDFDVRWRVADTLGVMPSTEGVEALITGLADPSYYARNECAWALARVGLQSSRRLLARLDGVPRREWPLAALALGRSSGAEREAVEMTRAGLLRSIGDLRTAWIYAAGEIATLPGAAALGAILGDIHNESDSEVRVAAAWTAGELGSRGAANSELDVLIGALRRDSETMVRAEAAVATGKLALSGSVDAVNALAPMRSDPAGRVRYSAWQMTGALVRNGLDPPEIGEDEDFGARFEIDLMR